MIPQTHGEPTIARAEQPLRHEHVVHERRDLLRIGDILGKIDISRATWFRWVRSGKAPQPVPNMPGYPRWRVTDIERFVDGRKTSGRHFFGGAR